MNTTTAPAPDPNAESPTNLNPNKDKKNSWLPWVAAAILLILLLIFHPWSYIGNNKNELNQLKAKQDSTALAQANKAESVAYAKLLHAKDSALQAQQTLLGKVLQMNDSLAKNCPPPVKPRTGSKPKPGSGSGTAPQRVIVTLLNQSGLPIVAKGANVITPRLSNNSTSQPANYNTEVNVADKTSFTREISEKKFCFRFGTEARGYSYYPHLAVMDGAKFPELVDNKIGGYDLFILPSGSVGDKDYGIAADGTRYIKKSLIDKYISQYGGKTQGINDFGYFVDPQFVGDFVIIPADGNVFTNK